MRYIVLLLVAVCFVVRAEQGDKKAEAEVAIEVAQEQKTWTDSDGKVILLIKHGDPLPPPGVVYSYETERVEPDAAAGEQQAPVQKDQKEENQEQPVVVAEPEPRAEPVRLDTFEPEKEPEKTKKLKTRKLRIVPTDLYEDQKAEYVEIEVDGRETVIEEKSCTTRH